MQAYGWDSTGTYSISTGLDSHCLFSTSVLCYRMCGLLSAHHHFWLTRLSWLRRPPDTLNTLSLEEPHPRAKPTWAFTLPFIKSSPTSKAVLHSLSSSECQTLFLGVTDWEFLAPSLPPWLLDFGLPCSIFCQPILHRFPSCNSEGSTSTALQIVLLAVIELVIMTTNIYIMLYRT